MQVEAALAAGTTEGTIVNDMGVSRRTVQRFRKNMRAHGNSRPEKDGEKRGRKPVVTEDIATEILEWMDEEEIEGRNPTMDAAVAFAEDKWQMKVGRGAVAAALRRIGWAGPRRKGRDGDAWGVVGEGVLSVCLIAGLARGEGNVVFAFVSNVEKMQQRLLALAVEGVIVVEVGIDNRDSLKRGAKRVAEEMSGKMEALIFCPEDTGVDNWKNVRDWYVLPLRAGVVGSC